MLPTKTYTLTIPANSDNRLLIQGEYFKILSATNAVSVKGDFGILDDLISGQGLESTPFNWLLLSNKTGVSNTIRILIGDQNFVDGMSGAIAISENKQTISGLFTNTAATVTNASAQLIAANPLRQYLLIQNNDTSGSIFLEFGSAATLTDGLRLGPLEAFEMATTQSSQSIFAIGSIASNTKIVIVQG
jgi:hypothetical protein